MHCTTAPARPLGCEGRGIDIAGGVAHGPHPERREPRAVGTREGGDAALRPAPATKGARVGNNAMYNATSPLRALPLSRIPPPPVPRDGHRHNSIMMRGSTQ